VKNNLALNPAVPIETIQSAPVSNWLGMISIDEDWMLLKKILGDLRDGGWSR